MTIRGRVTSNLACMDPEEVVLKKGGTKVGPMPTRPKGDYRFRVRIMETTVVRVGFIATASCLGAWSATRTITVG